LVGEDGKTHLFCARWPEANVDPAWRKSSEIVHYVVDRPEGPYTFRAVVLKGSGRTGEWDAFAPSNPEIKKFGDTYALVYIANSDFHQPPHPKNQQIGMVTSKSLDGPWKKVADGGPLLGPSPDPNHWTHGSQVVNPTLLKVGDKYHLYFKARYQDGTAYGLAIADRFDGPYRMEPTPLTYDGIFVEDGSAFEWNGKICLLTTDNHGKVTGLRGGGALWVSDNGKKFVTVYVCARFRRMNLEFLPYRTWKFKSDTASSANPGLRPDFAAAPHPLPAARRARNGLPSASD